METAKKISTQLSLWIFIWFLLMGLALAGFGYWQMGTLNKSLQGQINLETLTTLLQNSGILFLQVLGGSLVFFGRCPQIRYTDPQKSEEKPAAPPDVGRKRGVGPGKPAKNPTFAELASERGSPGGFS